MSHCLSFLLFQSLSNPFEGGFCPLPFPGKALTKVTVTPRHDYQSPLTLFDLSLQQLPQLVTPLEPVAATTTSYSLVPHTLPVPLSVFQFSPFLVGSTFQEAAGSPPWIYGGGT